ncbi:hypothetical protein [cf. Phormidesmis sp. LEGE 11477]|uniref:hypothetical protein n=1 Tax=cf. Phormidesmis sp. LEGE 11477 TaxID=1828680 RepID=UPI0018801F05|nr:hypothetical protein [cf. Phormidesmis sp. LEGE 11477]MBE9060170.1 hypothetical protein [cf. Phormidesmis sp. LEGE 11477]
MSISPSKHQQKLRSPQNALKRDRSEIPPLSIFQALTITAGMAGLVGLISGAIIRFSLTTSPNARFLSPIQTFPTSSDWESDSLAPDSNSSDFSPDLDSEESKIDQINTVYPSSFDEFASRSQRPTQFTQDPLEKLRSGPLLRESANFDSDGVDITIPELEDPVFEPYFDADTRPFSQ